MSITPDHEAGIKNALLSVHKLFENFIPSSDISVPSNNHSWHMHFQPQKGGTSYDSAEGGDACAHTLLMQDCICLLCVVMQGVRLGADITSGSSMIQIRAPEHVTLNGLHRV